MSQVGHFVFLPGCPILLEPAWPGPDRDGEPSGRKPSHQGSFGKHLYLSHSLVAFTVPCLSDIWVVIPRETQKNNERDHLIGRLTSSSYTKVSQNWFPVSERLLATGVLAMSLPLGIVCGQGISPQFVVILCFVTF